MADEEGGPSGPPAIGAGRRKELACVRRRSLPWGAAGARGSTALSGPFPSRSAVGGYARPGSR